MTKIIIADNQPLTALAVETLCHRLNVSADGEYASVEHATNKHELGELLKNSTASSEGKTLSAVVILDYTLFDFNNPENLTIMCDLYRDSTMWLLLSEELTSEFLRYVLYGTSNVGVAYKDASIDVLSEALRFLLRGERYIAQHATELLLQQMNEAELPKVELTQTEREILKAIAQGKTTKEIAAERFSSFHTVNSHRKNIFRKLNVNCAHDAMKYALRAGLVDESEFYI